MGIIYLPGIDFPSSKYSLTDGLRKLLGITGLGSSVWSSSNRWLGSGPKAGDPDVRGFFARFERVGCSSEQSAIKYNKKQY